MQVWPARGSALSLEEGSIIFQVGEVATNIKVSDDTMEQ
jgi:hypothetical protein